MPELDASPASSPAAATVIPAATVVIFRHAASGGAPELLMVQRSQAMRFAGGAVVFPGGKVDPADHELAASLAIQAPDAIDDLDEIAHRIAAIRETLEETGLALGLAQPVSAEDAARARALLLETGALAAMLDHMGWRLALDSLVPFARWCPNFVRTFDTRFYLADLGSGSVDITVDATENSRLFWMSAADVLAAADAGELSLIFPTRRNLERLAQFASFAEVRAHALATPVRTISPAHIERDGEAWLTIPDGLGYPVLAQPMSTAMRG